jgi:hypothetical protein
MTIPGSEFQISDLKFEISNHSQSIRKRYQKQKITRSI